MKIAKNIFIIFVLFGISQTLGYVLTLPNKHILLGFPYKFYTNINADCYFVVNFRTDFLIANVLIFISVTTLIYFIAKKIKAKNNIKP